MRVTKSFVLLCIFLKNVSPIDWKGKGLASLERVKRQEDDRWIWTFLNATESNRNSENQEEVTENIPTTTEVDPCVLADNPETNVPDFRAPGRRISDVKCFEYIYGIKARLDQLKRSQECLKYNLKYGRYKKKHGNHAIGGRDALPKEFPHMVGIGWKTPQETWIFKCGGSLISEKFVLTAGHCTRASERDTSVADVVPQIVRLGDKNISNRHTYPNDQKIIRIISHPNYKPPKKYFDIALMELEKEVTFDKFIQPACLSTGPDDGLIGQNATITGWGVVETAGRTRLPELQAAVVDVLNSDMCDNLLKPSCNRHWCGMQEHQLCAGKLAGGVDACQGDSGGPLQTKIPLPTSSEGQMYYVIGVTSFGVGCALKDHPGIYTRVSSFVDWVEDVVWK